MTATSEYIERLAGLKAGDLALLRTHAGQGLDETANAFDLFAGLWWPLRERTQRAPRRSVAWLIAKVYAHRPIEQSPGASLARQIGLAEPEADVFLQRFDHMIVLPLAQIEPSLQWAVDAVASAALKLDWVRLTNDLSVWTWESTRARWADEYLTARKGE